MKVKVEIDLKPFSLPNYVVAVDDGDGKDRSFPISVLDSATLDGMCEDFRVAMFKKAGKQLPPIEAERPHDHKSPRCWCGEANYGASQSTSGAEHG